MKEQRHCHTSPFIAINMDEFITLCVNPGMHQVPSPVGEGTHPCNALEYFLGTIKKINLFPRSPKNDVSNIEDVPDSDSVNSHILFDMVVERAVPTSLGWKRFRPPLVNAQPGSHEMKVERATSLSQSVQTVRIHKRVNQVLGASPRNPNFLPVTTHTNARESSWRTDMNFEV